MTKTYYRYGIRFTGYAGRKDHDAFFATDQLTRAQAIMHMKDSERMRAMFSKVLHQLVFIANG
jgi:hypothetical protein